MAANLFCRGTIEPAYYYLGSDYRGSAGNSYTLSYMSQMGGWSVLDYALHYANDPTSYLQIGIRVDSQFMGTHELRHSRFELRLLVSWQRE